jgi:two-component system response regulator AtoC
MVELKRHVMRLGKSDLTVLISGESGTGKELVARAIHKCSARTDKPFIKVNSAALPMNLFESELFGFEKGAFTGAFRGKPGKFQLAHSGTILLDEVGEIPLPMQAKLLQVLEDREFSALGSTTNTRIDARVLAATNANLGQMLSDKRFRLDLYYRLSVVSIHVPPLRQRREDIDLLSDHFLRKYAVCYGREYKPLSECMRREFCQYWWPGNVRELESIIQCIIALGNEDVFYEKVQNHGPSIVPGNGKRPVAAQEAVSGGAAELLRGRTFKELCKRAVRKAESHAIVDVLTYTDWNRKKAAALLRTSYRTLLDRIKEYEIERATRNYPQGIEAPGSASSLFS